MKTNIRAILLGCALAVAVGTSQNAFGQKSGDGQDHHKGHGKDNHQASAMNNKGNFSTKIYRVTQADSVQKIKMKPALDKTSKRLEVLRANYQRQEKMALDSLNAHLKPILKDEQMKRLNDWMLHQGGRGRK